MLNLYYTFAREIALMCIIGCMIISYTPLIRK